MLICNSPRVSPDDIIHGDWQFIGQVEVPARPKGHQSASLALGTYKTTDPEPVFVLNVEPDSADLEDAFVATLDRLDDGETYTLIYMFNNFGNRTYHVKVWRG